MDVEGLIERALRKVQVTPAIGGGTISADGGATSYITDDGYRYANPDGPALAEALSRQKAAGDAMAEALRSARAHIGRGRDMVPDDDESLASDIFARAINHAERDLADALTAWNSIGDDREG